VFQGVDILAVDADLFLHIRLGVEHDHGRHELGQRGDGHHHVGIFSSKILPVPSSTTRMDWEPKGTAMAAVESVISTAANIF